MKPTKKEVIDHIRDHYGLSLTEALEVINTPLHPRGLRDEFAGQALAGLSANRDLTELSAEVLARYAYQQADAMLKARET